MLYEMIIYWRRGAYTHNSVKSYSYTHITCHQMMLCVILFVLITFHTILSHPCGDGGIGKMFMFSLYIYSAIDENKNIIGGDVDINMVRVNVQ